MIDTIAVVIENTKTCIKCKETKKVSLFRRRKDSIDGFHNSCAVCTNIYAKEYKLKNAERIKIRNDKWKESNPDKIAAYTQQKKTYRVALKEKNPNYYKDLRNKNIEKRKQIEKKYREKNKETINLKASVYQKTNPNKSREKHTRRISELSPVYIRQLLKNSYGIPCDKVPLALLNAKTNYLKLVREIRKNKRNDKINNA